MQRAAAAGADHVTDIEPHIRARQVIGKRSAMGRPFGWLVLDLRTALMGMGEIAVEILKSERQLIGVEALGTRALQLFDDRFETLDLAVAALDRGGDIAHQAMQKCCICREIAEIELHARFYSNMLIRRSKATLCDAGFCDSASQKRTPEALRCAPVDALEQHRELRRRQRHRAARFRHARLPEAAMISSAW